MQLQEVFEHLVERNEELGLARLDPTDINIHFPFTWLYAHRRNIVARYAAKFLKVPAVLAPVLFRWLMRIRPYVCPTAYSHLGRAYWDALTWDAEHADQWRRRLEDMCETALADSIVHIDLPCWGTTRPHMALDGIKSGDTPCAHMTARIGLWLLLAGKALGKEKYIDAAFGSARIFCDEFNWHTKPHGQMTVSFFTDSEDETINVCADVVALLAELIAAGRDEQGRFSEYLEGLIRTINAEQDANGKWMYVTHDYYDRIRNPNAAGADCPHSAYIISALLGALAAGVLDKTLAEETQEVAAKGLKWYCKTFFRHDGFAIEMDSSDRETSIAGYGEGVVCMCDALQSDFISAELKAELDLEKLSRAALETAIHRFVDFKTWDVASYRFGWWRVKMRSIRWGSGVLMEAISHFLACGSKAPV